MVFGNVKNVEEYKYLGERLQLCFAYAKTHNLAETEKGRYEIEGKDLFVNVVELTTNRAENCGWEAHKKYLDVHLVLKGREQIDVNFIENMEVGDFDEAGDYLPMTGDKNASVVLSAGDYLVCYPSDGHRPGVAPGEPGAVKKAIFKIRIC